jgi:hypothetical protein
MPINEKMMESTKKLYGDKKGEEVYYSLENLRKQHRKTNKMLEKKVNK